MSIVSDPFSLLGSSCDSSFYEVTYGGWVWVHVGKCVCVCNTVNETLEKIFELFDSTKYIYYNFIEKNPYFHWRPLCTIFLFLLPGESGARLKMYASLAGMDPPLPHCPKSWISHWRFFLSAGLLLSSLSLLIFWDGFSAARGLLFCALSLCLSLILKVWGLSLITSLLIPPQ